MVFKGWAVAAGLEELTVGSPYLPHITCVKQPVHMYSIVGSYSSSKTTLPQCVWDRFEIRSNLIYADRAGEHAGTEAVNNLQFAPYRYVFVVL
jgi:hypothetical protein